MNLFQVYKTFPNQAACIKHLEAVRWNGKPICPYCESDRVSSMESEARHHCNSCNTSFSVTVGTMFHNTRLDLQKWFLAICLILNAKKGIAARQLARDLDVNKNTAWYLAMRIRKAMLEPAERDLLEGLVEMDETYIGGKPRKGSGGDAPKHGRGTKKTPVIGMVERGGKIKAQVRKDRKVDSKSLMNFVRRGVNTKSATLITDEYRGYLRMEHIVDHKTVNHKVWYVDGINYTNTCESFWALLKRGIGGQYHKVSVHHLSKYVDEFTFRFHNRNHNDIFGLIIARGLEVA